MVENSACSLYVTFRQLYYSTFVVYIRLHCNLGLMYFSASISSIIRLNMCLLLTCYMHCVFPVMTGDIAAQSDN